jgi:hypothetical protein
MKRPVYLVALFEVQYLAKVALLSENKCSFLNILVIFFGKTATGGHSV